MIEMFIDSKPFPKGRPRFTRYGGVYTPKKTLESERDIHDQIFIEMSKHRVNITRSLLSVEIKFIYKRPKKIPNEIETDDGYSYRAVRPDVDNLAKLVLDAMNGVVYIDDSQICSLKCEKLYGDRDGILLKIDILGGNSGNK